MSHKVQIIGNLGRDPEMRYTPAGKAVVNFSVASTRRWKDTNGNEMKETVWVRCATWGKMAEIVNENLQKGDKVEVWGRLSPDANGSPKVFTKQDGTASASYEIHTTEVNFLNVKKWADGNGAQANNGQGNPAAAPAPAATGFPASYGQGNPPHVSGVPIQNQQTPPLPTNVPVQQQSGW
jgi:single-strand DNA-binding protein